MEATAQQILKDYYGYDTFRRGQAEVIEHVMKNENTLAIMPTGGGKSICYQVPALMRQGTALIISPLISLMKDQVDALTAMDIPAAYINSTLEAAELEWTMQQAAQGAFTFLYVAPERLENTRFLQMVRRLSISLIAFDEAHCISQWGHDFRPSYRSATSILDKLTDTPPVMALTATATPQVADDIQRLLDIQEDFTTRTGFARDNLRFQVVKGADKERYILDFIQKRKQDTGIIYAPTRKLVDQLSLFLDRQGVKTAKYHAGMSEADRQAAQSSFIQDEVSVMIATNAFGMGIDKSNVRYVLHYALPMNMEAYYQEAGRAGRDGEPSDCVLLFSGQDVHLLKFLIENSSSDTQAEYQKLQQMMNYCHTQSCLQTYMLHYFQDPHIPEDCGRCSNCLNEFEKTDMTREAQMVLSCVKRMDERFGAVLVAKVLKGSKDKRIKQFGLESLSTYGIMKNRTEKDITQFIHYLSAEMILAPTDDKYPVLTLTDEAVQILKGEKKVMMQIAKATETAEADYDEALFQELRELRKEIAQAEGLPPYVIFSDATLKELCRYIPHSQSEMLGIKGIGERRMEQYGEQFLEVLKQHEQTATAPNRDPKPLLQEKQDTPSHLISFEAFEKGSSMEEIAKERGLTPMTVSNHLFKAYADGEPLDLQQFFTAEQETAVLDVLKQHDELPKLRDIKEQMDVACDYHAIRAVLVHQGILEQ
ncbi:DNA helicase RecQ [Terribacillus saccharophilus]|uniref:DNA helicase RecQ n=1 Tax=Terribacillus saccharophilus TaxID=361277 RepID=UPI002DC0BC1B|nr:DNA helicase RecQ [Terribacillus saccharophilus]